MQKKNPFVGREAELSRLEKLRNKNIANLIVVRGRRRIGKSRLLAEFGKSMKSYFFTGTPPVPRANAKFQKKEFARQMRSAGLPPGEPDDWGNLLWTLSKFTETGEVLIVLDEISWMGARDPGFLGKLKNIWDMHFSKNPNLILALCGSISSWIEDNILSSTGFVGRITVDMLLEELPLDVCNEFWRSKKPLISSYEKFKILSVTGGVPLYLEHIDPALTAEQNISDLCFTQGGLLVREFDDIFSDLFSKRSQNYREIITCLADGPKDLPTICKELNRSLGGVRNQYLTDLVKAGFLQRDFTWDLKNKKMSKNSRYRLSDNYLRFYLKYIEKNRMQIERGSLSTDNFVNWEGVMGLQFENLVVHNRKLLWSLLGIKPSEIIMDGPFFQTSTARQAGCQIDYMIQTRFSTLYICEVKFSKNPIGKNVIDEMEEKCSHLKRPRYCSIRPVLVHVNGVEECVYDAGYFDAIIDFAQFLTR